MAKKVRVILNLWLLAKQSKDKKVHIGDCLFSKSLLKFSQDVFFEEKNLYYDSCGKNLNMSLSQAKKSCG